MRLQRVKLTTGEGVCIFRILGQEDVYIGIGYVGKV